MRRGGKSLRCAEEMACSVFDFSDPPAPRDRFELYRNFSDYMTKRRFLLSTGGAGATHTFRSTMREFEREFPIDKEPSEDGSYLAFLYFLRTALFWERLNALVRPDFEPLPLCVLHAPREVTGAKTFPIPVKGEINFTE